MFKVKGKREIEQNGSIFYYFTLEWMDITVEVQVDPKRYADTALLSELTLVKG